MRNRLKLVAGIGAMVYLIGVAIIFVPILTAEDPYDDGRINQGPHLGSSVIYCRDGQNRANRGNYREGGIEVYNWTGANTGQVFFASEAEIQAVTVNPDAPVLIKSENGFRLYWLPDGQFQLNGVDDSGNEWAFIWEDCIPVITVAPPRNAESDNGVGLPPVLSGGGGLPTATSTVTPLPAP